MTSPRTESRPSRLYRNLYSVLCGQHPQLYPWHLQWLAGRALYARLRNVLPSIGNVAGFKVLDVGCGGKPYRSWFGSIEQYTGVDVFPGPQVDVVITSGHNWPFPDCSFDAVLCTQVLEHVQHLDHAVSELTRVLKPNGIAIVTVPFLYNQHGAPFDFRRFTATGARALFGDVVVVEFLNWWDEALGHNLPLRLAKAILLPLTIVLSLLVNLFGLALDSIDRTQAFYANVFMVLRKRGH
jgi:SAM-dependent methyltransferase